MLLADGIDLPFFMMFGCGTIVTLTLLVSLIEVVVFRLFLKVPLRQSFWRIVGANLLSTAAGGLVYFFQDPIIGYWLSSKTLINFGQGYVFVALLLILLYYGISVLAEGLVVARRKFAYSTSLSRRQLWRGVIWANVASYLVMGPLFYFVTRPTLPGVTFGKDAAAVTSSDETVYYCRAGDEFLCRIAANGSNQRVVVPYPVKDFVVATDQESFAYRSPDNNLYYYHSGAAQPVLVWTTSEDYLMCSVDISPDGKRVAYLDNGRVQVFDSQTARTVASREAWSGGSPSTLAWDRSNSELLYLRHETFQPTTFRWNVAREALTEIDSAKVDPLGQSFRCCGTNQWGVGQDRISGPWLWSTQGEYKLRRAGFFGGITVDKGDQRLTGIHPGYGLLMGRFGGMLGPIQAVFLTEPGVIVCEGQGQIYVFDSKIGKLALLAAGSRFVIANNRFQMSFAKDNGEY